MTDPVIESMLREIRDKLTQAWHQTHCTNCPLAELAALAGAIYVYYQEQSQK